MNERPGWPDVVIAVVAFAREDVLTFALALFALAAFAIMVAFAGWLMFPRLVHRLAAQYGQRRETARNRSRENADEP